MVKPAALNYREIRDYAEQVAEHHALFSLRGAGDVEALVEKLGGRIAYRNSSEALDVKAHGDFTINLPNMTSARRDRFTIAHELGHYFLHYLLPAKKGPMAYGRGEQNLVETQANVFAASLLMPARLFTEAHREFRGDQWRLADRFDVSPAAVEVRIQVLGL